MSEFKVSSNRIIVNDVWLIARCRKNIPILENIRCHNKDKSFYFAYLNFELDNSRYIVTKFGAN